MPYYKRNNVRTFKKRSTRPYRRRVAKPMVSTYNLTKRVNALSRQMRQKSPSLILTRSINSGLVTAPLFSYGLDQYPAMTPVFGTATDDLDCNRALDKSDAMDINVTLENSVNNEEETINFTCYLVQLKDAIGTGYASGALALTNSIHYVSAPVPGASALLNLKYFRILKTKKFTLTNYGSPLTTFGAQSQYGTSMRWTWKLNQKRLIQSPTGNFNSTSPVDPSQARFLILFNDNSAVDGEFPTIQINHVKSLRQIA